VATRRASSSEEDPATGGERPSANVVVRILRTRTAPWIALSAILVIVAVVVLHGEAQAIVGSAAFFVFLFACIRYVGLGVRDDSVRSDIATRWVTGVLLTEYSSARRRRRRARTRRRILRRSR
jgi:hypothetical protein